MTEDRRWLARSYRWGPVVDRIWITITTLLLLAPAVLAGMRHDDAEPVHIAEQQEPDYLSWGGTYGPWTWWDGPSGVTVGPVSAFDCDDEVTPLGTHVRVYRALTAGTLTLWKPGESEPYEVPVAAGESVYVYLDGEGNPTWVCHDDGGAY